MKLHGNAALSLNKRRLLCQRVVDESWSLTEAAAAAEVSDRTAGKWVAPLSRRGRGRSARPLLGAADGRQPHPGGPVEAIAALRRLRFTGAEIAELLAMPRDDRLGHPDPDRDGPARPARAGARLALRARASGRADPRRRQEARPDRAGRRQAHHRRRLSTTSRTLTDRDGHRRETTGWEYVHVAIDDATRLAYAEVLADERAKTAVGFLGRAVRFFRRHGITGRARC